MVKLFFFSSSMTIFMELCFLIFNLYCLVKFIFLCSKLGISVKGPFEFVN